MRLGANRAYTRDLLLTSLAQGAPNLVVRPAAAPWRTMTTGAASSIRPGSAPAAAAGCGSRCSLWATGPLVQRAIATRRPGLVELGCARSLNVDFVTR